MDNLEFFQKFRENLADIIIDRSSSQTSTDDHKYRLVSSETTEFATVFRISGKKFLADRSSCKNCFVSRKIGDCLRKITADFGCRRETEFIGKTWVMSDSWISAGIFKRLAAITTGTVTKPPLEKQRPVSALSESFWPG